MRKILPQLNTFCYQVKGLVPGMDYIQLSHSPQNPVETPKIYQTIGEAISCSPQSDAKAILLKMTFIYLTELREVELVHTSRFHPY